MEANPGLKSRVSREIEFPSYDGEELFAIFERLIEKNGFNMSEEAAHEARKMVEDLAREGVGDKAFGNARVVRQAFESLQTIQAERLGDHLEELGDLSRMSDEDLMRIEAEDVMRYAGTR